MATRNLFFCCWMLIEAYSLAFGGPNLTGQEKKDKIEPKLTIYDDEHLKGKSVIIRKRTPDLHEVKFSDKSESIAWEVPPGKAFVVFDEKNFKLPILVLVGKGAVQDLGKEQRNALHSITAVAIVTCPKGRNPYGISKDVPKLGEEDTEPDKTSAGASKGESDDSEEMVEHKAEELQSKTSVETDNPAAVKPKASPLAIDKKGGPSLDELLAAEKMDLRPDPNFKDKLVDVAASAPWFLTARKGDFVEYRLGKSSYTRQEVIEKTDDTAIVANIVQISKHKSETRVRMKLAKDQKENFAKKLEAEREAFKAAKKHAMTKEKPGKSQTHPPIDTINVNGHSVECMVRKVSDSWDWISPDVPFEGLVKTEYPHRESKLLTDFARGE